MRNLDRVRLLADRLTVGTAEPPGELEMTYFEYMEKKTRRKGAAEPVAYPVVEAPPIMVGERPMTEDDVRKFDDAALIASFNWDSPGADR